MKEDVIEQDTEEWQSNFSFAGLERVGGMDLSYLKEDATRACASLVVLSYPELELPARASLQKMVTLEELRNHKI
uniref:Uncharacterized protein n=1 Tax=Pseudonaja textilis TaxID=8673 RepID=A0A670XYA9_PSETE